MTTEETSKKTIVEEKSKTESPSTTTPAKPKGKTPKLWQALVATWSSRKLWMTVFSVLVVYGTYWHSVNHLYSLTRPEQITALSTMYIAMLSVLGVVIAAYLGTNALSTRFGVSSAAQLISQTLTEKHENTDNYNENVNRKEEVTHNFNYKEYIVEEGVNTDEPKPYGKLAVSE